MRGSEDYREVLDQSGEEPVSAEQIRAAFETFKTQLGTAYQKRIEKLSPLTPPESQEAEAALAKMNEKVTSFADGLVQSGDFQFLAQQLDFWGGLATSIEYGSGDIARATELLEQAVNGVQGMLFSHSLITDEAKDALKARWTPNGTEQKEDR